MKFASIVLLAGSASAVTSVSKISNWNPCLAFNKCATAGWACCNLVKKSWAELDTTGTMICADPTQYNGIVPSSVTTYGGGMYLCSKNQLIAASGAVQLAGATIATAVSAMYLM